MGIFPAFGSARRKVIPTRAIQLMVNAALDEFDPAIALTTVDRAKSERAAPAILAEASAAPR